MFKRTLSQTLAPRGAGNKADHSFGKNSRTQPGAAEEPKHYLRGLKTSRWRRSGRANTARAGAEQDAPPGEQNSTRRWDRAEGPWPRLAGAGSRRASRGAVGGSCNGTHVRETSAGADGLACRRKKRKQNHFFHLRMVRADNYFRIL
jgi:hypothetical protein